MDSWESDAQSEGDHDLVCSRSPSLCASGSLDLARLQYAQCIGRLARRHAHRHARKWAKRERRLRLDFDSWFNDEAKAPADRGQSEHHFHHRELIADALP